MANINKIFLRRTKAFDSPKDYEWIAKTLKNVQNGSLTENVMTLSPVRPKGGDVIVYRTENSDDRGYLEDQYFRFDNNGTQIKSKYGLTKVYYVLKQPNSEGKKSPVDFKKHVYKLNSTNNHDTTAFLIHYLGNEELFVHPAHGNSKKANSFYTATSSETKKKIKEEVVSSRFSAKTTYNKLVNTALDGSNFQNTTGCEILNREAINTPRNSRQLYNFKAAQVRKCKINKCEIFSIYEMAKQDLGKFVLKIDLHPYDIFILAEPAMLKLTNDVLQVSNRDQMQPQLLCYDTTFNMADSYVSVLVARNIFIVGNPIMPVAFMIHDRKSEDVHRVFWETISKHVDLSVLCQNVPLCTDREKAITNAIYKVIPGSNLLFCSNHLRRDVKAWLSNANGTTIEDTKILSDQISCLLDANSSQEFDNMYTLFENKWSASFVEYMKNSIQGDLKNSSKLNSSRFAAFDGLAVTNNLSESFNFVLKYENEWKEVPIDVLSIKLNGLQCQILLEFSRASRGIGNYRLKQLFSKQTSFELPSYVLLSAETRCEEFKKNIQPEHHVPSSLQSKELLAQKCVESNLVSLVPSQKLFVVRNPYTEKVYNVQPLSYTTGNKVEDSFHCNCNSVGLCMHILAVLKSTGQEYELDGNSYKLSVLKKKSRGHKLRAGRKKPNPVDLIDMVEAADDSKDALLQKLKHKECGNEIFEELQEEETNLDITHRSFQAVSQPKKKCKQGSNINVQREPLNDLLDLQTRDLSRYELFLLKTTASTLNLSQWLDDKVMDNVIKCMISRHKLNISYIECVFFKSIAKNLDYSNCLQYCSNNEALNTDVMFVCPNNGTHWMLGVILNRKKKIILIDSFSSNNTEEYPRKEIFNSLLKLAAAASYSGNLLFYPNEWELIFADDAPFQNDSTECGIITILTLFCLLNKLSYPALSLNPKYHQRNRNWALILFAEYLNQDHPIIKTMRMNHTLKKEASKLLNSISIGNTPQILRKPSLELIAKNLYESNTAWTTCGKTLCSGDPANIEQQILCVSCGLWYHRSCSQIEYVKECTYFKCSKCSNLFVVKEF